MGAASRLNPFARDSQVVGPPIVRDTLGRPLDVGDQVVITQTGLPGRVATITPMVHPGAPPNFMQVRIVVVIDAAVPRGAALEQVYRTATAAELGVKKPEGEGAPPPPPADPPEGKVTL